MGSLQASTAIEAGDVGGTANIDPAWDIWGPCGGYVASIALRGAGLAVPAAVVAIDIHVWTAHLRRLAKPVDYVAPSLDLTVWFHQSAGAAD